MAISKKLREEVYQKCNGKCGYCGKELNGKFQVDHIEAFWHSWTEEEMIRHFGKNKPTETIENLMPACARCNKWKDVYSLEQFRKEISLQLERLNLRSSNYRMALDYGLISETPKPIKFYFEAIQKP
jgi:5-methylcytosine-specific restriction endonuclease McrA